MTIPLLTDDWLWQREVPKILPLAKKAKQLGIENADMLVGRLEKINIFRAKEEANDINVIIKMVNKSIDDFARTHPNYSGLDAEVKEAPKVQAPQIYGRHRMGLYATVMAALFSFVGLSYAEEPKSTQPNPGVRTHGSYGIDAKTNKSLTF